MSFFANSLDRLMKERDWTQTELERRSGITQSQISRYLRGVFPEADALEKICKPFDDDAGVLVADWLRDLTPEALRHLVTIAAKGASGKIHEEPPANILAGLPPHARKILTDLAAACKGRPAMVAAVESMLALTRL